MSLEDPTTSAADITRAPGGVFWNEGDADARPFRVREGIVAYRRGGSAIGLLGPGQVALPVPGVPCDAPAAADLIAVTFASGTPLESPGELSSEDLSGSVHAVVTGAGRLGGMSLPQRLAAVVLEITERTGQPVVQCRQDLLAMAAGARRETVATVLSEWREAGWVETRYRRCKVLNRDALIGARNKKS